MPLTCCPHHCQNYLNLDLDLLVVLGNYLVEVMSLEVEVGQYKVSLVEVEVGQVVLEWVALVLVEAVVIQWQQMMKFVEKLLMYLFVSLVSYWMLMLWKYVQS
jgi:hypothetical protein